MLRRGFLRFLLPEGYDTTPPKVSVFCREPRPASVVALLHRHLPRFCGGGGGDGASGGSRKRYADVAAAAAATAAIESAAANAAQAALLLPVAPLASVLPASVTPPVVVARGGSGGGGGRGGGGGVGGSASLSSFSTAGAAFRGNSKEFHDSCTLLVDAGFSTDKLQGIIKPLPEQSTPGFP